MDDVDLAKKLANGQKTANDINEFGRLINERESRISELESLLDAKEQELKCLKRLLRYPYNLPMNEAGDYDEGIAWKADVEQALKGDST